MCVLIYANPRLVYVNSTLNFNKKKIIRYEERRNGVLIGLLKYLHEGPKVFKEKQSDSLFAMPDRKDVEKKAKEILIRIYQNGSEKESDIQDVSSDEMSDSENDVGAKIKNAMRKSMAKPASPDDKQFKSLRSEMLAYDSNGRRSTNLDNLYYALLSIKPTSVSSERAFSISGTFLTKRRARLKNSIIDDLCFSKDFLEKNEKKTKEK